MPNPAHKIRSPLPEKQELDAREVLEHFEEYERSGSHRRDAFKIEGNLEDAVRKIARAKPKPKRP